MLVTYFNAPFTLRHLRAPPGGPYLEGFATDLAQAGYCRDRVRAYLRGAGRFSAWAADVPLTADAMDSQALAMFARFLDAQGRLRYSRGEFGQTFLGARNFVRFLQLHAVVARPPAPTEPALLREFCHCRAPDKRQ